MKTQKIISFKKAVTFSLMILLLLKACAQSGSSNKTKSENNPKAKVLVAKPEMDIQAAIISGNLEVVKQHIEAEPISI